MGWGGVVWGVEEKGVAWVNGGDLVEVRDFVGSGDFLVRREKLEGNLVID